VSGSDSFTRDEVRELLSQVALDFFKLGEAESSIVDLNGAIETYLESWKDKRNE
jgi:hypothetical protein